MNKDKWQGMHGSEGNGQISGFKLRSATKIASIVVLIMYQAPQKIMPPKCRRQH